MKTLNKLDKKLLIIEKDSFILYILTQKVTNGNITLYSINLLFLVDQLLLLLQIYFCITNLKSFFSSMPCVFFPVLCTTSRIRYLIFKTIIANSKRKRIKFKMPNSLKGIYRI